MGDVSTSHHRLRKSGGIADEGTYNGTTLAERVRYTKHLRITHSAAFLRSSDMGIQLVYTIALEVGFHCPYDLSVAPELRIKPRHCHQFTYRLSRSKAESLVVASWPYLVRSLRYVTGYMPLYHSHERKDE